MTHNSATNLADLFLQNPATDEYIADVSIARLEDVDKAVAAAEKAQPAWANTPAHIRARIFRKFADLIHENSTKLQEVRSPHHNKI